MVFQGHAATQVWSVENTNRPPLGKLLNSKENRFICVMKGVSSVDLNSLGVFWRGVVYFQIRCILYRCKIIVLQGHGFSMKTYRMINCSLNSLENLPTCLNAKTSSKQTRVLTIQ